MRNLLFPTTIAVLLSLPSGLLAQSPVSEPIWPDEMGPVATRMWDDLTRQRWMVDTASGDLLYRRMDPYLDVEVPGSREFVRETQLRGMGERVEVVGVRWMTTLGVWQSEVGMYGSTLAREHRAQRDPGGWVLPR